MFYGNAQSIVVFVRNLLKILMGFLQNDLHLKSSFDKTKYIFYQSIYIYIYIYTYHSFAQSSAFLQCLAEFLQPLFVLRHVHLFKIIITKVH